MNDNLGVKENVVVVTEKNGVKKVVGEKKSFRDRLPNFLRNVSDPKLAEAFHKIGVIVVLENQLTGRKQVIEGPPNIVTTVGNHYYAELAAGQVPTLTFANISLCTAGPNPVLVTSAWNDFTVYGDVDAVRAKTATYPKCPDVDADNTGLGATVTSWKFEWTAANGPFVAIQWFLIAEAGAGAGATILSGYRWAVAWDKDAATSCKVFVNHTFLGA